MKRILFFTFIFLGLIRISFVSAFIGESIELNLYNKVDSGVIKIKKQLMEKELKGSSSSINNIMKRSGLQRYFDENWDFSESELNKIKNGSISDITKHLKSEYREDKNLNTGKFAEITKTINEWRENKNIKVEKNISNMTELGSIGLYYDGDTGNSGYDIMYDMEQINSVIFSKDLPYNGKENINTAKLDFGSLINSPSPSSQSQGIAEIPLPVEAVLQNNNTNPGTGTPNLNPQTQTINSTDVINNLANSTTLSNKCITGNILNDNSDNTASSAGNSYAADSILNDKNLLNDINDQLVSGTNSSTSIGGQTTQDAGQAPVVNNGITAGSSLSDTFPCSDIFCIQIEFTMYTQNLLGGSKTKSIESILEKNYKIADKISSTPLIQSEMTKTNFSLSILKNLKLGKMLHMGIVISSLPLPILSLNKGTPSGNGGEVGIKQDFIDEQIYINSFSQYGLKYKSQNDLSDDAADLAMKNCLKLNTEDCNKKLSKISSAINPTPQYNKMIYNSMKNEYLGSFNNDLMALIGYSQQLGSKIDTITNISKKTKKEK
ncbi:MAG: hypothetical protein PHS92_00520 [Candidatus Gracilibacteria bacterium]|nr:hypothetical protein [Candidatus Gracilibacteria bacterium]